MAAATMYVTVAGADTKTGADWAHAMGLAEFVADLAASAEAGDIYYIAGGTYTLTANLATALDGTSVDPITMVGVNSSTTNEPPIKTDWASGDNRPLIAAAGYDWSFDDYWAFFNLRCTISDAVGWHCDVGCKFINCKCQNTSGSDYPAFRGDEGTKWVNCEGASSGGTGFEPANYGAAIFCYAHDSLRGFYINGSQVKIAFSVADTCTYGIIAVNDNHVIVLNNSIYNCSTSGIEVNTSGHSWAVINNIINDCGTGINCTTKTNNHIFWNNNIEGCSTATTNVETALPHSDANLTTADPEFTNAAGGNFSLAGTSDCIDAGQALVLGVG